LLAAGWARASIPLAIMGVILIGNFVFHDIAASNQQNAEQKSQK
jgi:hypothetical protein